jgi:two-component system LytT family response regulator
MRTLKALIVDDERLARQRLRRLLLQAPDVEVVADCKNVREASPLVDQLAPDLLFVDVQMPRASGFELVGAGERPLAIIFVTAYEQYAVQAFDVQACDYLLKPVTEARLKVAMQRARELLGRRATDAEPSATPEAQGAPPEAPGRDSVLVRAENKVVRVRLAAIDWIEAAGNYVLLHVGPETHLQRETLTAFEAKLPAAAFARIHRTTIVNLDRVVEFEPMISGDFLVTLQGGARLRMSRSYRGRIRDLFGHSI